MICPECGTELSDGSFFCTGCGAMLEAALAASEGIQDGEKITDHLNRQSVLQRQFVFEQDAARTGASDTDGQSYGWSFTPASSTQHDEGASVSTATAHASRRRRTKSATGPDLTKRRPAPMKAVLVAVVVAALLIVGGAVLISDDALSGDDSKPPTGQISSTSQIPPEEQAPSSGAYGSTSSSSSSLNLDGMNYTVSKDWERSGGYENGFSYSLYGDDYWGSIMATNVGEGFDESYLDRYLNTWTTSNEYSTVVEVIETKTMTIDDCPAVYAETMVNSDGHELFESNLAIITPSGNLVEIWATCTGDSEECKADIHDFMNSISFP